MSPQKVKPLGQILQLKRDVKSNKKPEYNKLKVSLSEGVYLIDFVNIVRIQASGNYSIIHTVGNAPLIASKPLKYYQDQLPIDRFIRIHSAHLISISQLYFISKDEVLLKDKTKCPISRSSRSAIKELLSYM